MDTLAPPTSSGDWNDCPPSPMASGSGDGSSRKTTHARGQGMLTYWVSEGWRHFRPFLPFILISCLVVVLVYLLQSIVYGGPFTDPNFFTKFEQRWPRPALNHISGQQERGGADIRSTGEGVGGSM